MTTRAGRWGLARGSRYALGFFSRAMGQVEMGRRIERATVDVERAFGSLCHEHTRLRLCVLLGLVLDLTSAGVALVSTPAPLQGLGLGGRLDEVEDERD